MSEALPTRQIVIDDTDNRIVYSGPSWTTNIGDLDKLGIYGPTYNHTSHGTDGNSSLSFSFDGTSISVFGTIQPAGLPTWECFVDQVSIRSGPPPSDTPSPDAQNNWILCEGDDLMAGSHTLSIRIAASADKIFWFDYLRYTPFPDASFSEAVLYVPSNEVNLSSNWEPRPGPPSVDGAGIAFEPGATATFDFVGTHVAWYGWFLRFEPLNPANVTVVIDDGEPGMFQVGNKPQLSNFTQPNILFFETPQLSAAQHRLVFTFRGSSGGQSSDPTPLSLNYLLVTITSTPFAPSSPPSSTPSSSQPLPSTSTSFSSQLSSSTPQPSSTGASRTRSPPVGAIVGGVGGGIFLVAVIVGLCFLRSRRRYRRREQLDSREAQPQPFTLTRPPAFEGISDTKGAGQRNDFFPNDFSSFEPNVARIEPSHKPPLFQPFTTTQPPTFEDITSITGSDQRNDFASNASSSSEPVITRIHSTHKPPLY